MNKALCTQAYNDLVEFTARLAAYSTSALSDLLGSGHYESRANELAIRDSIFLSISIRRLVELTNRYELIKKLKIPTFVAHRPEDKLLFYDSEHAFSLWETIQNIIHARYIEILKTDADFRIRFGGFNFNISDFIDYTKIVIR